MNAGKGRLGTSPRPPGSSPGARTVPSWSGRHRPGCPLRHGSSSGAGVPIAAALDAAGLLGEASPGCGEPSAPGELLVPAFPPQITEKTPSDTRGTVTTLLSCKPAPRELRTGGLELRDSQAQGDPPRSCPLTAHPWRAGSPGYGAWVTEQGIHGSAPAKELFIQSGTPVPHQQSHCSQRWRARESQNHRY